MTSTYSSSESFTELEPRIQQLWDSDYRLVDVEYIDEQVIGIFNEKTNGNAYITSEDLTEFEEQIVEQCFYW